ncbi:MAG: UDP-N-acetylglucosamine--N-acetylmuramyl-(pentapeptide) pyrophosphoryl-undecaprenol N-acetylglucosamine transferase [Akkermansiaceae bacterium]|nr:UDP-N-acetylglucosamine--N-acetylmuramyl-(pentapeptide) pyrophosphoryl-undecaprenol N-acetylglucosamine transferase [Akkermansiaceae bacterium]
MSKSLKILIACGGTGGHLFPGIAVAEALRARGHQVMLLISEKKSILKRRQNIAT